MAKKDYANVKRSNKSGGSRSGSFIEKSTPVKGVAKGKKKGGK